jgi:hypothetical protein
METEKIEIVLDEREFSALMQLVFLGNYVANSIRDEDHKIREYQVLDEKLTRLEYEIYQKISGEEAEYNELADLWDYTYDAVDEYLEDFEKDVFRERLSRWITWKNYPIIPHDEKSLKKHWAAEAEYIKLIKESGIKFIQISAPKIDDRINIDRESEV